MGRRTGRAVLAGFLREAVWRGRFHYTGHARDEMLADGLDPRDVRLALLRAKWVRTLSHDPRGPRHIVRGECPDGQPIEVVWRRIGDQVRIVTVYSLR